MVWSVIDFFTKFSVAPTSSRIEPMTTFVSLEDAAKILRVSTEQLLEMRAKGMILGYRDDGSWKFKPEEIDRLALHLSQHSIDRTLSEADDSGPATDAEPLDMQGSDLELTDDSDLALRSDSGINLMSPDDSSISLEDEPLDLAASGTSGLDLAPEDTDVGAGSDASAVDFQQDEEFQLSASGSLDVDDDSGSQVIELEDSSEFGDGATALPAEEGFDAFADVDGGGGLDEADASGRQTRSKRTAPVRLGVGLPDTVLEGQSFVARFVIYEKSKRNKVKKKLKLEAPHSQQRLDLEDCELRKGARVTLALYCSSAKCERNRIEFTWNGSYYIARFDLLANEKIPAGFLTLCFDLFVQGVLISNLRPEICVTGSDKTKSGTLPKISLHEEEFPKTAFASYAKADRHTVLSRIRSLQIFTDIDVFVDCLSIRPGDQWERELEREIEERDIFWLFWSRNAMRSRWVNWEWKTALSLKSIRAIQPHPLEATELAPPPEELSSLQFGSVFENWLGFVENLHVPDRREFRVAMVLLVPILLMLSAVLLYCVWNMASSN